MSTNTPNRSQNLAPLQTERAHHGNLAHRIARTAVIVLTVVAGLPVACGALLLVLWGLSFRDPAPGQDNCAFGSVSNDEYRRLLAEAKSQKWTVWPGLSDGLFWPTDRGPLEQADGQAFEARLGQHFRQSIEQLTFDHRSADAQLAAAHAVMRSIRAEYVSVGEVLGFHTFEGQLIPPTAQFTYFLPQLRFAPFCAGCLIFRYTTLRVFFDRNDADVLAGVGVLNSDLKYSPDKEAQRNAGACPRFLPRQSGGRGGVYRPPGWIHDRLYRFSKR